MRPDGISRQAEMSSSHEGKAYTSPVPPGGEDNMFSGLNCSDGLRRKGD
jgi:hypothetical protein